MSAVGRRSPSIRTKFVVYLVAIHAVFTGIVAYVLWSDRIWLIAVELLLLVSFLVALRLFRLLFRPLEVLTSAAEIMKEKDFTTRFRTVGQPELDALIDIYNRMVDSLNEERIRQQEQHFFLEKVIAVSPSGILTFDYDGKIESANPSAEKLLGTGNDALAGRELRELRTPFADALAALPVGGAEVLPLQGMRRLKCHKAQFMDRGFPRVFVLIEELTEELRQSEKFAYEKLIRMMSHEVNNSLGAANSLLYSVLHYASQLKSEDRKDFEDAIGVVISRTEHLNAFMKSFADIVRLPLPRKGPVDPLEIVRGVELLMRADAQRRKISWVWRGSAALQPVPLDKVQMEQVVVNVVKNAFEAIGEEGTVTVEAGKEGARQFLAIEDSGCGIPPDVRRQLFLPFFTTKENGQGIGLTTIREILTRHDLQFSLESVAPRRTRFIIWF